MNELVWMADLKTSTGTIRAEFTDCQQFQCSDRAVMEAYSDAMLFQQTEVRPINAAFGSVLVESSNSKSVASFVYSVVLDANPDLDATFYGKGYIVGGEPYDPTILDSIPPEITESTEQPKSQFGFEWPPSAAKSTFGDE
ncbi:MAG: hypothetical protein WCG96_11365 [Actinomycetes bacterium]